jgi:O-methyltransferase domain/Dimerisation domain
MTDDVAADRRALLRLTNGLMVSGAIHAFTSLGLADLIGTGRRTGDDLAEATGTNPPALRRLLSALAAMGILDEDDEHSFALTPLGDGLRADAPGSVAGWAAMVGTSNFWQNWGQLADSVRTGQTGWRLRLGVDNWTYREQNPEAGRIFDRAMVSLTSAAAEAVLESYDLSRFPVLVDAGGGWGMLLAGILARYPAAKGVLFDQPHVVDKAEDFLRGKGVLDRCQIVGGSFFESVPEGHDAYILKSVIHDWYDPEARVILQSCRRAMTDKAALLLVERVLEPLNQGLDTKLPTSTCLSARAGWSGLASSTAISSPTQGSASRR